MTRIARPPRFEYVIQFNAEVSVTADEYEDAVDFAWMKFRQMVLRGEDSVDVTMAGKFLNEPED